MLTRKLQGSGRRTLTWRNGCAWAACWYVTPEQNMSAPSKPQNRSQGLLMFWRRAKCERGALKSSAVKPRALSLEGDGCRCLQSATGRRGTSAPRLPRPGVPSSCRSSTAEPRCAFLLCRLSQVIIRRRRIRSLRAHVSMVLSCSAPAHVSARLHCTYVFQRTVLGLAVRWILHPIILHEGVLHPRSKDLSRLQQWAIGGVWLSQNLALKSGLPYSLYFVFGFYMVCM